MIDGAMTFPTSLPVRARLWSCHLTTPVSYRWHRRFASAAKHPAFVQLVEVGPRDGLQNEATIVSVADKVQLIRMLAAAGCTKIEAASFVSPKWVPAMANSADVMRQLTDLRHASPPVQLSGLVPNLKYLEEAMETCVDEIAIFASASETFSQKNINCSISESLERYQSVVTMARHHNLPVRGYVSCVIACPYEGPIAPSKVGQMTQQLLEMGCHQVSLGDTIGVGTPATTRTMLDAALLACGGRTEPLAVHFHDTFGQALVNILVSLERGIATVDSSVAGLGGCPYAKGASGNVATEDVVYMLHGLGVETGIDIDQLVDAGDFICGILGKPSSSKAGTAIAAKRTRD